MRSAAAMWILLAACLPGKLEPAESAATLRSRFEHVHVQRFRISDDIRLTIAYDSSGDVFHARIAPPSYTGTSPEAERLMDTKTVDGVLETLAPGILGPKQGQSIRQQMSRIGFLQANYKSCHLSRQFVWTNGKDETGVVDLTGTLECCGLSNGDLAFALERHYSLPEYEQFSTDGNVDLGAVYSSLGSVVRIDLDPTQNAILSTPVVERLINHFAPPEVMDHPKHHVVKRDSSRDDIVFDKTISTTRSYKDGVLVHASITWIRENLN